MIQAGFCRRQLCCPQRRGLLLRQLPGCRHRSCGADLLGVTAVTQHQSPDAGLQKNALGAEDKISKMHVTVGIKPQQIAGMAILHRSITDMLIHVTCDVKYIGINTLIKSKTPSGVQHQSLSQTHFSLSLATRSCYSWSTHASQ